MGWSIVSRTRGAEHDSAPTVGGSDDGGGGARGGLIARSVYRLLARCHRWAESGWGGAAVGGWALLQGSVMPGPSDALLIPLGVSDPGRVFRLASWAVVGAALGGVVAYLVGAVAFDQVGRPLLGLVGVGADQLDWSRVAFARHGWQLVVLSAISPLPTKAVCIVAGAFHLPVWQFIPAIIAGRALRFYGIATLVRLAGPGVLNWLLRRVG